MFNREVLRFARLDLKCLSRLNILRQPAMKLGQFHFADILRKDDDGIFERRQLGFKLAVFVRFCVPVKRRIPHLGFVCGNERQAKPRHRLGRFVNYQAFYGADILGENDAHVSYVLAFLKFKRILQKVGVAGRGGFYVIVA